MLEFSIANNCIAGSRSIVSLGGRLMLKFVGITALAVAAGGISAVFQSDTSDNDLSEVQLAALDPSAAGRNACRGIDAFGKALDARLALAGEKAPLLLSAVSAANFPLYPGITSSDIGVTGIDGEARRYFDQGVALLYGFNHAAAARSFRKARAYEPACAMCWWGEAYANGLNINSGMSEDQNRAAIFAVKQAKRLSANSSPVEKALIEAQYARFPDDLNADRAALEGKYSEMMVSIAQEYPSNDIAVLAAESAMNTTPWNYWDLDAGEARPQIKTAISLIERVMENNPRHPQASHLYIHLMENSPDPKRSEAAADRLVDNAPPALGHLVHMPAHIFYRIGRYKDSMAANIKAARADEEYLKLAGDDGLYRFGYYPHNVHFLLASAQMAGDVQTVANETQRLKIILDNDIARELPWVQAIHAAPYYAMTQFSSTAAVLALTQDTSELAYVDAMRHYARAVAYARQKNQEGFDAELAEMARLKADPGVVAMVDAGFPAPNIIELAMHVAEGRKAYAESKFAEAIQHYQAAQAIEATVPYNEPPYWYYPVAQSLGAAHYRAGQYREALAAFREAIYKAPNNGWALYGLSKTERKLGNSREAKAAEAALENAWMGEPAWLRMDRL
jgi:tetratricopeptide (TPR) repeat protein